MLSLPKRLAWDSNQVGKTVELLLHARCFGKLSMTLLRCKPLSYLYFNVFSIFIISYFTYSITGASESLAVAVRK